MKTIRIITLFAIVFCTSFANAQTEETIYYPKFPNKDISGVKADIAEMLKTKNIWVHDLKNGTSDWHKKKNIVVLDDKMIFEIGKQKTTFYFSDILDYSILVNLGTAVESDKASVTKIHCYFNLGNFQFSYYYNEPIMQLADDLFFMQYQLNIKRYDSLITAFKPIAAKYCALKVKPTISEEQRKYVVQANSFNEQKEYRKAIELYIKAIEIDQTAYSAAYSNLALLSAQIQLYDAAIYYMKKYLLLEPEATDARSSQDKIYEWEAKMTK